ncbi:hypothetical protein B1H58_16225 [Pantoea alhagi]|uniref:Uncharacterized protein n=1 Tax=Pantoea alhagi TaxID=1891675 RepID=A0A1W6B8N5_9GAMM|nr:hypothetical protein [Pantoea alhagi]ARJ43429.1 hypothetical protein B1H58_16225 [Pantoea alhagi]
MRIQHLLLSSDGYNRIIEAEKLEDELVVPTTLSSPSAGQGDNAAGHRVVVKKHYCKGKYYAVALDRHAASNEIDDVIDLLQPAPID